MSFPRPPSSDGTDPTPRPSRVSFPGNGGAGVTGLWVYSVSVVPDVSKVPVSPQPYPDLLPRGLSSQVVRVRTPQTTGPSPDKVLRIHPYLRVLTSAVQGLRRRQRAETTPVPSVEGVRRGGNGSEDTSRCPSRMVDPYRSYFVQLLPFPDPFFK